LRFLDRARAGLQSVSARPGSGYGWRAFGDGATGRDWSAQVGKGYDVAPIYSAVNFACRAFSEVEIIHERPDGKGGWQRVVKSQIEALLNAPNPWYTWDTYLSGCLVSEMAGFRGVSFTYKHRSSAGRVVGLEYMPHHGVHAYTATGSGDFVTYYRLNLGNGQYRTEDPRNILLQRFGFMNPMRPQESVGPLSALYLEIANIRQAGAYTANMLSNVGAGKLLSPGTQPDGTEIVFGDEQEAQVKQAVSELKADGVGGFAFVPLGVRIDDLQFSPADLKFDAILNISDEHIASAFLIAPASMYYGTGLENQNNRASAEAAAKATARSFTKPYMQQKNATFTADLVPELGEPGDRVRFKVEDIEALQEDKTETAKRDQIECQTHCTVNEKREEKGKPPIEGGDTILWPKGTSPSTDNPDDQEPPPAGSPAPVKPKPKGK
jgi:hypothetical protein